jgi:NTE family protein
LNPQGEGCSVTAPHEVSRDAPHRDALLGQQLQALFPDIGGEALAFMQRRLEWVELAAGETLIKQGEAGDSAYLTISGRLRVYVADDNGSRVVRELSRGQVIGEMSLYTGEPRSATVVAVRDSVLVRLAKPHFEELLLQHPQVSLAFTRQMIRRLQTEHQRHAMAAPVTIGLLPASTGVDLADFGRRLAQALQRHGRVCLVDAGRIAQALGSSGLAAAGESSGDRRLSIELDRLEATHDFVLLLADSTPTAWTRRCVRNSDEMLLVADATRVPGLHEVEQACLVGRPERSEAAEILVLLHPAEAAVARGARRWLDRRPVTGHVNLRPALERDMARLARLLSRTAVGLVLAGGGARGFAHLGVWQALTERGIEVDVVGGTSIGAIMAAAIATDAPVERVIEVTRRTFARSPTGDYNLLPLVSLIKGGRVRRAVRDGIASLVGGPIDIEDLWKGYYCIASNYSQAREERIVRGDLGHALLASSAIPGALPPQVSDGSLLCDGGTFNNFPVDVMREVRGVGRVIGVDLGVRSARRLEFDDVPGSWTLLLDRLRPRARQRYRLPSLTGYLLNITILYSTSRQREAQKLTDLYINPPLYKIGLLQWSRFDAIVRQGYAHAVAVLDAQPAAPPASAAR